MFPSGSTRPDQPTAYASNEPASALFSDVVNSVGDTVTLMPTAASIDWMTWPSRALTGSVPPSMRLTDGLEMPDAWTSFFASATFACRLHASPFVVGLYHGLTGAIGKQSGWLSPLNTTLLIVVRSSARSK